MPKPKHSVEALISICHWHAHGNGNMSTHNSRAWINYWTWIRNSVDGQCTTRRSKCNVSNEKNVRCRCLWPHTSFCIQQIGSTTKKNHNRMRHTLARAAMLCYPLELFFSSTLHLCPSASAPLVWPIVYNYMRYFETQWVSECAVHSSFGLQFVRIPLVYGLVFMLCKLKVVTVVA